VSHYRHLFALVLENRLEVAHVGNFVRILWNVVQGVGWIGLFPGVNVMITLFVLFCLFSAKKLTFFWKTNVMIKMSQKLLVFLEKTPIFCNFFWRKYFQNKNIGPSNLKGSQNSLSILVRLWAKMHRSNFDTPNFGTPKFDTPNALVTPHEYYMLKWWRTMIIS
jgi:hypothetical protein